MDVLNEREACLAGCGASASGACTHFCGAKGACCESGSSLEWECDFGRLGCDGFHCCVRAAPAPPAPPPPHLLNVGLDCWMGCGQKQGECHGFCGAHGACCKGGFPDSPIECGSGSLGCLDERT